ncbi:hypothetical protein SAMN05428971_3615 [Candidatus Pantoea varia]|uniref:Uncharacterized protein n=1 Tax=Candidatus Pantoea varia TaxID=1881036 RepID=A0A1I5G9N0_9GAMM|nr:hypothetical protein [Pantoea varia]SFO32161.1 hypothetical protein SAMN05428971_3615 [Pantoea varia]
MNIQQLVSNRFPGEHIVLADKTTQYLCDSPADWQLYLKKAAAFYAGDTNNKRTSPHIIDSHYPIVGFKKGRELFSLLLNVKKMPEICPPHNNRLKMPINLISGYMYR